MKVSGLLLLVLFGCLWSGCFCLPAKCEIQQRQLLHGTSLVLDCNLQNLITIPEDIPSNVVRLTARYNNIRNVTHLPQLPQLEILDLSGNCMEWFSWTSLRALPVLRRLNLDRNKLRNVQLDIVIEHLPKLQTLDVSFNNLTSLSQYELEWAQVTLAFRIAGNPFHCDCDLSWLIDKMACLQACKERDEEACCRLCPACFLANQQKRTVCHSPSGLNRLPLSDVSTQLTGCGPHQLTTKAAMATTDEAKIQSTSQSQAIVTNTLHATAHYDTKPKPTESNYTMAKGIAAQNIVLSAMAGTMSCLTIVILCYRLYKRKCYMYIQAD